MTYTSLSTAFLVGGFLLSSSATAQVTNGKSPELPPPFATKSSGNAPEVTNPPKGFLPTVPKGFSVNVFAVGFKAPRFLATAPNGDIFVADSAAGKIYVLRDPQHTGGAQEREEFAAGLDQPFGIVFHEGFVYVGDTDAVVRFPYDAKTSKRKGEAEKLLDLPNSGAHWTRDVAFTADGKH